MRLAALLCTSLSLIGCCATAKASTITELIVFKATGTQTAAGSFTLTFDPTKNYTDETSGLVENYLRGNFANNIPFGFTYNDFYGDNGELVIGGLLNGAQDVFTSTYDWSVRIEQFPTDPLFGSFLATFNDPFYATNDVAATLSVTPVAPPSATAPEPSTLALLGTGVLGIVGLLRRQDSFGA